MKKKCYLYNKGFTLIEVLVAIVVLSIGILSLFALQTAAIGTNQAANQFTIASNWASDRIEILLRRPYDCITGLPNCHDLDDDNGDGTNQDPDNNGIDDDGGNFGLDNATPATADGSFTSPDGLYTILWNVAIDTPVPNSKTIRVIVITQDNGMTRTVPMTYIKAKTI